MTQGDDKRRLVIATHNAGKLQEFAALLAPIGFSLVAAGDLGLPEPEETGDSFAANALIKARAAAMATGMRALADDSGFSLAALDGAPGIYSARWAGPRKDFGAAMRRIHGLLGPSSDRAASFTALLALVEPDGQSALFEGRVDGKFVWPPRGDNGHGYDPCFVPSGANRTFAEMGQAEKDAISHRGIAVRKLIAALRQP